MTEKYLEKVEAYLLDNGFIIDPIENIAFKEDKSMSVKLDDIITWDLDAIDKLIYLIDMDFIPPDENGMTGNGVINVEFEDFMACGDLEDLKLSFNKALEELKLKGCN